MIKFFTSYYANYDNIPKNYVCVTISRMVPDGFVDRPNVVVVKNNFIAPSQEILDDIKSGRIDEKEYTERYVKKICDYINNCYKYRDLAEWADAVDNQYGDEYKGVVFLCYEGPGKFCHRHIFARMLGLYGIECEELPCRKEDKESNALF